MAAPLKRNGLLFQCTANVEEIVGDDSEPDPTLHSGLTLVAAAAEPVSPLEHADASLASGPPFPAVAETALLLFAFASGLLVERLGMQTRLTPFAFTATSFLAE